jgi:hypothetical protein
MRSANLAAWAVGIVFGLLAIVLGLRVAFALSRGKGWRSRAFVIAICLATLWWPGFVGRICGQDRPPAQGTDLPLQTQRLKDCPEWQAMMDYWQEISLLAWDQKTGAQLEDLRQRGAKLAERLRPLEENGLLEKGLVAVILQDIARQCQVKPIEVSCYDSPGMASREVTWDSLALRVSDIRKLQKEGKLQPWTVLKLVTQARNEMALLAGKLKEGNDSGMVLGKSQLPEETRKKCKSDVQFFLSRLHGKATIDPTDEKPQEPSPELDEKIALLIRNLGNDSFEEREGAQTRLIEIGEPAFGKLRAAADSEDAEVRSRAKSILDVFCE